MTNFFEIINLERGLIISTLVLVVGLCLLLTVVYQWSLVNFGDLDYTHTMKFVIPGATLFAVEFQTILSEFFVSILVMKRK